MKIKYKKELKKSDDLTVGDNIKVGGLDCEIAKVDDVFHHVPNARIRLELKIVGSTSKKSDAILLLPRGLPITTLK